MEGRSLAACVAACSELLADEAELHRDFMAVFAGPRPRWERMPDDLRQGLADIAWEHLVARGLAPAAGDRTFILRIERRCRGCGGAPPDITRCRCADCGGSGWERLESRSAHPPTLCAALTLAADAAAMVEAEALAREATARLWPWRGRRGGLPRPSEAPRTIAWWVDEGDAPRPLMRGAALECPRLFEALARAAIDLGRDALSRRLTPLAEAHQYSHHAPWRATPEADGDAAALYDELAASDRRVPAYGIRGAFPGPRHSPSFPPAGRRFAELPNPLTPLSRLGELGVALECLEADAIVLARGR